MFTEKSFEVFDIDGLDERMAAIRQEVQPTFQQLDEVFQQELEPLLDEKLLSTLPSIAAGRPIRLKILGQH